jgi:hypothetical protein
MSIDRFRIPAAVTFGALFAFGLAAPALAQATETGVDDQVVITGRVDVPAGQMVGSIVILNGNVVVAGIADGDVFALNGSVIISGTVTGSVTVVNGTLELTDGARVEGDLVTQSEPLIAAGAEALGQHRSVNFDFVFGRAAIVGAILFWVGLAVSTFVIGAVFLAVAPRAAAAVATTGRTAVGISIGWGFAMAFGLPIAATVAVVTLVGIPLGIVLFFALAAIDLFAATTAAYVLGRIIVKPPTSPFLALLAGWGIFMGVSLVPFLGALAWFAAVVYGLGAITVAVWRARSATPVTTLTPATMPPPPPPS